MRKGKTVKQIDAVSEVIGEQDVPLLSAALGRAMAFNIEAHDFHAWAIATVGLVGSGDIQISTMFIPVECLREIAAVLDKYADKINEFAEQFGEEQDA